MALASLARDLEAWLSSSVTLFTPTNMLDLMLEFQFKMPGRTFVDFGVTNKHSVLFLCTGLPFFEPLG